MWGYRVGAFLVDFGVAVAVGLLAGWIVEVAGGDAEVVDTAAGLTIFGAWIAVTSGLSGLTGGQSLGKLIAGTRATQLDGGRIGFWWSFLRDTVCRLIYFVPFVFLLDSLWPLGSRRQTLRDKMTAGQVIKTEAYPRRAAVLTIAAVVSVGAWVGIAGARGGFEDDYTRSEWVVDCESEESPAGYCGCVYDELAARLSQGQIGDMEYVSDLDDLPRLSRTALNSALDACS